MFSIKIQHSYVYSFTCWTSLLLSFIVEVMEFLGFPWSFRVFYGVFGFSMEASWTIFLDLKETPVYSNSFMFAKQYLLQSTTWNDLNLAWQKTMETDRKKAMLLREAFEEEKSKQLHFLNYCLTLVFLEMYIKQFLCQSKQIFLEKNHKHSDVSFVKCLKKLEFLVASRLERMRIRRQRQWVCGFQNNLFSI